MKQLLLTLGLAAMTSAALAQSGYDFSYKTKEPYAPLTGGAAMFGSAATWLDQQAGVPLGFTTHIGSTAVDHFYIFANTLMPVTDTTGIVSGFMPLGGLLLWDKGFSDPALSSPVRYATEGAAPNRIFKLEYFNAGLLDEVTGPGTTNDSINFQVWVYETSDIIEFHYGDRQLSGSYFETGDGPIVGIMKNYDIDFDVFDKFYSLDGDPDAPTVDSTTSEDVTTVHGMPAAGTVYRYTPHTEGTSVGEKELLTQFRVYPTRTSELLQIDNNKGIKADAEVFTINGQSVMGRTALVSGHNSINVRALASGTYVLRLQTAQGPATYRFIKE